MAALIKSYLRASVRLSGTLPDPFRRFAIEEIGRWLKGTGSTHERCSCPWR
jgi:hypothetical protein